MKVSKVLSLDYRALGRRILEQFKDFVDQTNEQTFEMLLSGSEK